MLPFVWRSGEEGREREREREKVERKREKVERKREKVEREREKVERKRTTTKLFFIFRQISFERQSKKVRVAVELFLSVREKR